MQQIYTAELPSRPSLQSTPVRDPLMHEETAYAWGRVQRELRDAEFLLAKRHQRPSIVGL